MQFKMVFLMAIIARLPGWTHSSALGMFKLTEANEACSPNFCSLLPGGKRLEPAFGQGFAGVGMMGGYFAYNTPDNFSIPCILTLWRYSIRLRGGGISGDGRRDLRSSRRGRGYGTGGFGVLFPTSQLYSGLIPNPVDEMLEGNGIILEAIRQSVFIPLPVQFVF